jgi:hypothetical protein
MVGVEGMHPRNQFGHAFHAKTFGSAREERSHPRSAFTHQQ